MARRGARELDRTGEGAASKAWRDAVRQARDERPGDGTRARPEPEEWIDGGLVRDEAERAVGRAGETERAPRPTRDDRPPRRSPRREGQGGPAGETHRVAPPEKPRRAAPADVSEELTKAFGPRRAARAQERLMEAARAFERERFADARRMVRPLAEQAPGSPSVRELHGLSLYRLGRWRDAAKELEAFHALSGSVDQHPVLADSYRGLRRWDDVDRLWEELRAASPSAELVTEGRIVKAGALADVGDVRGAIALLERGPVDARRPQWHHLRLWYALADLYERAGDIPRARELFGRIQSSERSFADVAERLAALA